MYGHRGERATLLVFIGVRNGLQGNRFSISPS